MRSQKGRKLSPETEHLPMTPEFFPFSEKQLRVLTWWDQKSADKEYDAIICDGAIRSGKTFCMALSFLLWSNTRFDQQSFALCGKTISSLKRNVIFPLHSLLPKLGFSVKESFSQNFLDISRHGKTNRYYLFGGKDEASASLIQGMTLAGILCDEVALMPRSFVEQAVARCSVPNSRFWFNCNPQHPYHYFYREWILQAKQKHALYLHFTMEDNPSLTPEIRQRYEQLYSGVFYERFVKGNWVTGDGLVYPMFDRKRHVFSNSPHHMGPYYISVDYGTRNPTSFGLWGFSHGTWYRLREYYHDSRKLFQIKTDTEYCQDLIDFAAGLPIQGVIVDPSAASLMECLRRMAKFPIIPARNDVLSGIQKVMDALREGRIQIHESCTDTLREFSLYRWEEGVNDRVKKENDHAMDDIRYFVSTILCAPQPPSGVFSAISRFTP